jgi:hypothetical protein
MASIVFGIGTSHSPLISTPPDMWEEHARWFDMERLPLLAADGQYHPYAELAAEAGDRYAAEISTERFSEKYARCQAALAELAAAYVTAAPDVAIIVGDDQHEQFSDENMPAICVYWGETIRQAPRQVRQDGAPSHRASAWAYGDQERDYPVAAGLGKHLIGRLMDEEFDVAHSTHLSRAEGVGHAFSFVYTRVMHGEVVPHVPIMLNTYYPPNQPRPGRCYDLGVAIKRAVESWDSEARVAVFASGGLSHFVLNEQLDGCALTAMETHDQAALAALPRDLMNSGNSETLNWVVAAGALDSLQMRLVDYVPCHRTPAGTGLGAAFAIWT